jgi:DNA-binding MarR family transcriptional regulator
VGKRAAGPAGETSQGFAFLLVQLGFHAAAMFAARLAPLGLEPRQFGVLSRLASNEGKTQQTIAKLLGLNATRMVFLVDELERLGLVERRRNPADRRSHSLYLTDNGRQMLARAQAVALAHEDDLGAPLTQRQHRELTNLLRKLAEAQQIAPGSLPGATRIDRAATRNRSGAMTDAAR